MAHENTVSPAREEAVFTCLLCGRCCEGKGGIVVSDLDLRRLALHAGTPVAVFARAWCVKRGGKRVLRSEEQGGCVFFVRGQGCSVHEAKPDICRAWPYFRGNLVDSGSLELAKTFCPGIPAAQTHADFVRQGLAYLQREGLAGAGGPDEATALQVADVLREFDMTEKSDAHYAPRTQGMTS